MSHIFLQDPIYGLTVRLKGIPDGDYRGMPVPVQLEDLENGNFVLDLVCHFRMYKMIQNFITAI